MKGTAGQLLRVEAAPRRILHGVGFTPAAVTRLGQSCPLGKVDTSRWRAQLLFLVIAEKMIFLFLPAAPLVEEEDLLLL